MKVKFTNHFPFGKFKAISLVGRMYWKAPTFEERKAFVDHPKLFLKLIQHERTHWYQQKEMLIVPFFVWYGVEWFFKLFTEGKAYRNLGFEREARNNEMSTDYYFIVICVDGIRYTLERFKSLVSMRDLNYESIDYIDFIPKEISGSLVDRKFWNWTKYIFHR